MGDLLAAEKQYIQTAEILKSIVGQEHPSYATALGNLGRLYAITGDVKKAENLFIRSLDLTKNVLGDEHPSFASSLSSLANFYIDTGMHEKAGGLIEQCLRVSLKNIEGASLAQTEPQQRKYQSQLN